jgi:hypothetical protein
MALPPGFVSIDPIRHRAALVGRVIDQRTQDPLANATVEITDAPAAYKARLATLRQGRPAARPDVIATGDGGVFRWLDLPAGTYTLRASLADTRYAVATITATVVPAAPVFADLALAPTALTGSVLADNPAGPLGMARIRMRDSGEVAFTGPDGSFSLSPIEPGAARVIEFSAQRYATATRTVTLQRGQTTTSPAITLLHS